MTRRKKLVLGLLLLLPASVAIGMRIGAATTPRPVSLGAPGGKLAPCPPTPNCVSSQATDRLHAVEPIPYAGTLEQARSSMLAVLGELPRLTIVQQDETYIAAEARSATFRFVDDLDVSFDDAAKLIHIRSAARLGKGDLNVNRNRVEDIRQRFAARNP